MLYTSTRGWNGNAAFSEAVKMGIAPDGGLFTPDRGVGFNPAEIAGMAETDYRQIASNILSRYLDDFTGDELADCIRYAYSCGKFDTDEIAPVFRLNEHVSVLELWHGPTCAFKDVALQIMPHMLTRALKKTGDSSKVLILVATSGDTGKAALEGFKDIEGTKVLVFYPHEGVSEIQKMQMITQQGGNVRAVAVKGNFDDAQNGVKDILTDPDISAKLSVKGYRFSSANSINWGRLVPQIVYYFHAYSRLLRKAEIKAGDKINFAVPTGNFGNILAGYYACKMGLPINKLICASNKNDVLTEFINTGVYNSNREFVKTISPSMDILISSNLERLLFELTGHNHQIVTHWMNNLKIDGLYTIDGSTRKEISSLFWAGSTNDRDTVKTIEDIYTEYGYLVDTHTAVGIDVYDKYVISTGDMTKTIIASTASPFKFNCSVAEAVLGIEKIQDKSEFELLDMLSEATGINVPASLKGLDKREILHGEVCGRHEMAEQVEAFI